MNDFGQKLLTGWQIRNPGWSVPDSAWVSYVCAVLACGLIIRLVQTWLWTLEKSDQRIFSSQFWMKKFVPRFLGRRIWPFREMSDYWHPSVLGFLELLVFPVLMTVGAWTAIGAWFTLKTVAQWENWKTSRHMFNRFLIGNALLLIAAYILARVFFTSAPYLV
jgi:hypothetical protein